MVRLFLIACLFSLALAGCATVPGGTGPAPTTNGDTGYPATPPRLSSPSSSVTSPSSSGTSRNPPSSGIASSGTSNGADSFPPVASTPANDSASTSSNSTPQIALAAQEQSSGLRLTHSMQNGEPQLVVGTIAPHTLDLTAHADDIWDRIRNGFAIPNLPSPLVPAKQTWYVNHQDYLQRAVERSSRYLYHVVEELEKRGMPTELALLPFIESAYNPMAYSRAHASGIWQFIPSTGKNFKLKQDWWHDERRDVVASTDAALNYFQTLYEMYGDWYLALASYNWGEGAVRRAMDRNRAAGKPTDYLYLNMPDETRNYIPKLQALKDIIANPAAFGITLPRIDNQPYFATVTKTRDMDLRTAAKMAEMPLEEFRALNPSFNRAVIPGGTGPTLLVPADKVDTFLANMDNAPQASWQAHTLARGERLDHVAARYGMSLADLRNANSLGLKTRVRVGQTLLVRRTPESDQGEIKLASFEPPIAADEAPAPAATRTLRYVVKRGDTLELISRKLGVTTAQLRASNRIPNDRVTIGSVLTVQAAPARSSGHSSARHISHRAVAHKAAPRRYARK